MEIGAGGRKSKQRKSWIFNKQMSSKTRAPEHTLYVEACWLSSSVPSLSTSCLWHWTEGLVCFLHCRTKTKQRGSVFLLFVFICVCIYSESCTSIYWDTKKNCFRNPYLAASNPFCSERPDYENELNAENDEHYFMKLCNSRIICNRHRSIMTCFWCMCTTREILLFDVSVCARMCVSSTVF